MREQLEALGELARIDQGFRQLDVEHDEIQSRLSNLRTDVERMRDLLDREKRQVDEVEASRVQSLRDVEDLTERAARSSARLNASRNNREREATQREVEVLRREKDERAARATEMAGVLTSVREAIVRHEQDFAKLEELLVQEEKDVVARLAEIEVRRGEHQLLRKSMATKVRADLLRKYETIRQKKGSAVAEVVGGICRACHIALPPQLNAKLFASTEIFQCPSCQRLMVLRPATPTSATGNEPSEG